ncbi:DUF899 domain-containing protein [Edaphobacter sp. HDX4]|uniref:DUF899 domain-containing protein n=1 Tax=Edaphobacter sp. HDX4 TaxID=2794064 RepID=UPI002FE634CB
MQNAVVSRSEWLNSRKAFLAKEKELTRRKDALNKERLSLPWVKVEKEYVFEGPEGSRTLGELFGAKDQLLIYHFMFGPEWEQGCQSCSMAADTINGNLAHLNARDIALAVISRAPLPKIEAFRKRMGWSFPWLSSFANDFNSDFGVYFTPEQRGGSGYYNFGTGQHPSEEAPGISAFYRNKGTGDVFHTYSSYARGVEGLLGVYSLIDLTPNGRNEGALAYPMAWVRHHDRYQTA